MPGIHRLAGIVSVMMLTLTMAVAPARAQTGEDGEFEIRQIALDDARVDKFITTFPQISAVFMEIDKEYEPGDPDAVMDELAYLAESEESRAVIETKVKEAGFDGFDDWYDTAQSVMLARTWLVDPPSSEDMDASEAEIRAMKDITEEEREELLANLAEARTQIAALQPTQENLDAVKPHLDRLEGVVGGTN